MIRHKGAFRALYTDLETCCEAWDSNTNAGIEGMQGGHDERDMPEQGQGRTTS